MTAVAPAPSERYNEDQEAFAREVQRFLVAQQPLSRVRQLAAEEVGADAELWRRSAAELDLLGLMVPEAYGGGGFGFAETSVVLTAAGRTLAGWPFLSSAVLATHCLVASQDQAAMSRWLPGMANGETIGTVAIADELGSWSLDNASARAERGHDGAWSVTGGKSFVTDGQLADLVLVFAAHGDETRLFAVETSASGVERVPLPTLDATRKLSRLTFTQAPAQPVGDGPVTATRFVGLLTLAGAALACEASGGVAAVLDMTTQYARTRCQFGRAIGSFQSVKHRCAEIYMRSEASAALAEAVALAVASAARDGRLSSRAMQVEAATAAIYCCDAFVRSTHDMIQVHGGIGFTWEHDAHLFLRRAASSAKLFGGKAYHLGVLTRAIGDGSLLARSEAPIGQIRGDQR